MAGMFERYTEKARRSIFFARYEASQFGAQQIEAEHILLGLLREGRALARFFKTYAPDDLRRQIELHTPPLERISTSIDLPLSKESQQTLAYTAEEAERLAHKSIGTEHLLLGLLREGNSFAAKLLAEHGVDAEQVRQDVRDLNTNAADAMRSYKLAGEQGVAYVLEVADIEVSSEFYKKLGFRHEGGDSARGMAVLVNETCRLTLNRKARHRPLEINGGEAAALRERLTRAGLPFEQSLDEETGRAMTRVRDPDGHVINLFSRKVREK